jgi:pimeloyl-ACP methyl ester carboxylesterase
VDVQDWWSGGELVALELSGAERGVFVRRDGSGAPMTLLHGFPSSSHDWAKIAPALAEHYALTMPDLVKDTGTSLPLSTATVTRASTTPPSRHAIGIGHMLVPSL